MPCSSCQGKKMHRRTVQNMSVQNIQNHSEKWTDRFSNYLNASYFERSGTMMQKGSKGRRNVQAKRRLDKTKRQE